MPITFRRLSDDDLPALHLWLNDPDVVRWWEGDDVSWEGVVRDDGSANTDPVEHWVAVDDDGVDLGWLQCYAVADDPEETERWLALGIDPACAGVDYLVADRAGALARAGFRHVAAYDATTATGWPGPWRLLAIDRGPPPPR